MWECLHSSRLAWSLHAKKSLLVAMCSKTLTQIYLQNQTTWIAAAISGQLRGITFTLNCLAFALLSHPWPHFTNSKKKQNKTKTNEQKCHTCYHYVYNLNLGGYCVAYTCMCLHSIYGGIYYFCRWIYSVGCGHTSGSDSSSHANHVIELWHMNQPPLNNDIRITTVFQPFVCWISVKRSTKKLLK